MGSRRLRSITDTLKRDPVALQAEGMGELAVHRRPGSPLPTDRWAVDNARSAFAFVLRAVLADVADSPVDDSQLVPVGGTLQRFQALPAGAVDGTAVDGNAVDGTTLHPPVVVTPRTTATTRPIRAYLEVCRLSTVELLTAGAPGIEAVADLRRRFTPAWQPSCPLQSLIGPPLER
ncbi:hypothetical protein AB0I77_43095 [Streptomyces sp. NPDC050619]|uniref:hypothetical protein n=1 Tax=Streptomyces sp. NPDC050619 TaxID=3157214 RepID=UPI003421BA41